MKRIVVLTVALSIVLFLLCSCEVDKVSRAFSTEYIEFSGAASSQEVWTKETEFGFVIRHLPEEDGEENWQGNDYSHIEYEPFPDDIYYRKLGGNWLMVEGTEYSKRGPGHFTRALISVKENDTGELSRYSRLVRNIIRTATGARYFIRK